MWATSTSVGRRFAASNCWWIDVSNRGLARMIECPRRFQDMRDVKNSSGSMKTKPFMILKFSMKSLNCRPYRSENCLSLRRRLEKTKCLTPGICFLECNFLNFLDCINVSSEIWRPRLDVNLEWWTGHCQFTHVLAARKFHIHVTRRSETLELRA